ncbi:MAG: prohibitin family protein [Anaerolineae bacterium]|nr:prohibitin family protein [Anaerolineae bacterium]
MLQLVRQLYDNGSKGFKGGLIVLVVLVILVVGSFLLAFVVVPPGAVGVQTYFGAIQDEVLPEGLHMIFPGTQVIPIDVRIQKIEAEASASSKDLQIVTSRVALNFFLDKEEANLIFQNLGLNYQSTIIEPAIQESIKSTTAQFTAEELITRRPDVKESVFLSIRERLAQRNIVVTDFSIIDFNFSDEFNRAIEEKQVAEQRALRAQNDLDRIRTEAEQTRARAEGEAQANLEIARAEAEAQQLLRETLSPEIIQLRSVEKWNGILPTVMGSNDASLFFGFAMLQSTAPITSAQN